MQLLLCSCFSKSARAGNNKEHVLIIGAGISGLAAARTLVDQGCSVTVLEARNVIGGRIRSDNSFGVPIDLGASFIHGTRGNPLVELASRYGVETYNTDRDKEYLVDARGRFVSSRSLKQAQGEYNRIFAKLLSVQEDLVNDQSIQSVTASLVRAVRARNGSASADLLRFLLQSDLAIEFGADLKEMSLLYLDHDEEFSGPDLLLKTGYMPIVNGLARNLDIRLNQLVTGIEQSGSGVTVATSSANYSADRVIITLPLGILKRSDILFSPALPAKKLAALARLRMGVLDKTYFKFPSAFWQKAGMNVGYIGNVAARTALDIPEYYTLDRVTKSPILFGFTAGTMARQFATFDTSAVVASTLKTFRRIYGPTVPEPEAVLRTSWASDPFSYGSYSFIPVNGRAEDYQTLAEPINNRIFFAGEATNRSYPGTVHGAYLSGLREAERILSL